ncbi:MAG: hypothetical protein LBI03_08000 [Clostridiales bacterium]|jgi:hypothetical protein|nr:hypothetical protein [Clostridiales bacterium]
MGPFKENICNTFNGIIIDDVASYEQKLELENIYITGKGVFYEEVDCSQVEIVGAGIFNNMLTCDDLNIEGSCQCKWSLLAENIKVSGSIAAVDTVHTDSFCILDGTADIKDTLKCCDFNLESGETSYIDRIVAENCKVAALGNEECIVLHCDKMECYDADLEYCKVRYLKCDNIKLGKGCEVDTLECFEKLEINEMAKVGKIVRI